MFFLLFLNNLWQLPRHNPWPTHLTNKNYRIRFHKQHDYLFGFQAERRINKSLLLWNWAKNASNVEDDEYETLVLAYNKKLDSLISTSCITRSLEEEESSPPHIKDVVTNSKKEMENTLPPFQGYAKTNSKDMTLTPTTMMGSNKLNNSPMELGSTQYIQSRVYKHLWNWQLLKPWQEKLANLCR